MAKITYRGHEIKVTREEGPRKNTWLEIVIIRLEDAYIVEETPHYGTETVWKMIGLMKGRVDKEIAAGSSWEPTG